MKYRQAKIERTKFPFWSPLFFMRRFHEALCCILQQLHTHNKLKIADKKLYDCFAKCESIPPSPPPAGIQSWEYTPYVRHKCKEYESRKQLAFTNIRFRTLFYTKIVVNKLRYSKRSVCCTIKKKAIRTLCRQDNIEIVTKINTYTKTDFLKTKSKKIDRNFLLFYPAAKSTLWKCH